MNKIEIFRRHENDVDFLKRINEAIKNCTFKDKVFRCNSDIFIIEEKIT